MTRLKTKDILFLADNYDKLTAKEIAKKLKIKEAKIPNIAWRLRKEGVNLPKKTKPPVKTETEAIKQAALILKKRQQDKEDTVKRLKVIPI